MVFSRVVSSRYEGGWLKTRRVIGHGRKYAFEFKDGDAPSMTQSVHTGLHDLKLERLFVVRPGPDSSVMKGQPAAAGMGNLQALPAQAGIDFLDGAGSFFD